MTNAILSIKKSVFSRIKEFFAAPATQETQELTSLATTPISAVLEVANDSSVVNAKDHHDYAFNPAKVADNQGFAVKKNMPMNLALSLISAGFMSTLMAQQDEGTSLNQEPNARSSDSNAALRNLSYMAGLSPISGIYTAMLAEQKGLVVSNNEQENAKANDAASDNLSYIAGLSPISAVYTAQLAEQKGLVASKNEQESEQEIAVANNTALRNLIYMAGLAPISGIYTAMLAEQQGLAASNKEQVQVLEAQQEPKMNQEANSNEVSDNGAAWRNLSYMGGLAPISGIYASVLAEMNRTQDNAIAASVYEPSELEIAKNNANKALRTLAMSVGITPISGVFSSVICEQVRNAYEAQQQVEALEPQKNDAKQEHNSLLSNFLMRIFTYLGSVELPAGATSNILAYEIRAKQALNNNSNNNENQQPSAFATKALQMLTAMGNVEAVAGNNANVLADDLRAQRDAIVAMQDKVEQKTGSNFSDTAMRLMTYMGAVSPISGISAQALAEQMRAIRDDYERNNKHFAVENDGFAMSPAMSLISGVFCSALAQAQNQTQAQANTKPEAMIIEALNNQGNLVQDQHEIIKLYQNMYLERGYDQVQSLIMASVSAACNIKNNSIKPLADAATEERVAARWDSIWNQLSVDSSNLDKSMAANEQENVIAFKAPFERYYNTNGQLIQEQINNNKVA